MYVRTYLFKCMVGVMSIVVDVRHEMSSSLCWECDADLVDRILEAYKFVFFPVNISRYSLEM